MKSVNFRGIRVRLWLFFMIFSLGIIITVGILQIISMRSAARKETSDRLSQVTWSISATYGTDAYEKTIRAVVHTGQYMIKTFTEQGDEFINIGDTMNQWPAIQMEQEELVSRLKNSNGYFQYDVYDETTKTDWLVHTQVLASWDGAREIILVAKSRAGEQESARSGIIQMLQILAGVLVAAFALAWFLSKSFVKPIADITARAQRLTRGDYKVEFPENSYTEINLLSETLGLAANEFESYEQIRRDLIANLSHDMRTPLTMIKAYAEMIQTLSGNNPEKREEHLEVIIEQADKLSEFVNASLDLSKLQSNAVQLIIEKFSLSDLVEDVLSHLEVIYGDSISFHRYIDKNAMIKADRGMIEQVVYNLASNAVRYHGDDKNIEVYVHIRKMAVRFEVVDHGVGIEKAALPQIWIKYFKANPFDKNSGSTGVGLSIVKEILDLHKFSFGVESEQGVGSKFWFST